MSSVAPSPGRRGQRWPVRFPGRGHAPWEPSAVVRAHSVELAERRLGDCSPYVSAAALTTVRRLAASVVGLRVLHLSAGPFGSAVAELLAALVPLQRDLGIRADWRVLRCDPPAAWLALYEGLSGGIAIGRPPAEASVAGPADPWDIRRAAEEYDVILVHDPQLVELADLVAVALQMAVPRGFSAGVLECQWKSRPCVVGRYGQLPDQVAHGQAGVVVEGAPEAAGRIIEFVTRPDLAANMAQRARQRVAGKHLITGLLGEYTVLLQQLAEAAPLSGGELLCSMV